MVSAEDEKILRIFDLVREQQAYRFQRLFASIYVITQKKVVGLWGKSPVFEEAKKIVILAVDVAADLKDDIPRLAEVLLYSLI